MMAYGTAEEAPIFFQSGGVGTPRDQEGFLVGAKQRQDAFFNTAMQAMGPLTKGIAALGLVDDATRNTGKKADDFITLYRGDQAGVNIIKSKMLRKRLDILRLRN